MLVMIVFVIPCTHLQPQHEVPGQVGRAEGESHPPRHGHEEEREHDGDAEAALQDLVRVARW